MSEASQTATDEDDSFLNHMEEMEQRLRAAPDRAGRRAVLAEYVGEHRADDELAFMEGQHAGDVIG